MIINTRVISILTTVALFFGFLALIFLAYKVVIVLILSIFFAYILEPVVSFCSRRLHVSRKKGIAITYLGLLAAVAILGWTAGPTLARQSGNLRQSLPALVRQFASGEIADSLGTAYNWSPSTTAHVRKFLANHQQTIIRQSENLHEYLSQFGENILWILMIPVLAVFFQGGKEHLSRSLFRAVERTRNEPFYRDFLHGMDGMLAHYIRAKIILLLAAMAAYTAFLLILAMPYGFAIGLLAGALEFIPVFGPLLSLVIQLGMAAAVNFDHLILILGFWIVFRGIQDLVIMPKVMGRELKLPALVSIVAVLMGGEAAGILGMFLSIPAVITLRILWQSAVDH